ncbi:MAG: hypothetical protein WD737_14850 [Gemmatimonadota bacterium]
MSDTNELPATAGGREQLSQRLADISAKVDQGDFSGARADMFVGRWKEGVAADDVPEDDLTQAGMHMDTAHSALSRWPPDLPTATKAIAEARKIVG